MYLICDMLWDMSIQASSTDRTVSSYIRNRMNELGIQQKAFVEAIGRNSQSYISDRMTCKKSWELSELDIIAPLIGLPNALALIAAASGYHGDGDTM